MGTLSMLFGNPAVKKLEERLWERARKRYLGEHPSERTDNDRTVMRKVRDAYRGVVAATLQEEEQKIREAWAEFKKVMTEELKAALTTVLRMSSLEWYSIEAGQLPAPKVIAVPYQLLKRITAELVPQLLRKKIDFESLDDAALEALASYAADERFQHVLDEARHNHELFNIGSGEAKFTIAQVIRRDPYFLGEDRHHSFIDMVLLSSTENTNGDTANQRAAFHQWWDEYLKNRRDDRRFTGDGWEIESEELESWAAQP
ncbi:MAG TPA: hypothetical protein VEI73_16180 [Candidatus Acidoferrum sp.]|nr:hypothetical protein [Candidatus Acidoferrum sp.]